MPAEPSTVTDVARQPAVGRRLAAGPGALAAGARPSPTSTTARTARCRRRCSRSSSPGGTGWRATRSGSSAASCPRPWPRPGRRWRAFLGAAEGSLAFVHNATSGASTVLSAFPLEAGDAVLLTDHSYGAVRIAAHRFTADRGARVDTVARPACRGRRRGRSPRVLAAVHDRHPARRPRPRHLADRPAAAAGRRWSPRCRSAGWPCSSTARTRRACSPSTSSGSAPTSTSATCTSGAARRAGPRSCTPPTRWRPALRPLVASWGEADGFPLRLRRHRHRGPDRLAVGPARAARARAARPGPAAPAQRRARRRRPARGRRRAAASRRPTCRGTPPSACSSCRCPTGCATSVDAADALQDRIGETSAVEVAVTSWAGRGFVRLSGAGLQRARRLPPARRRPAVAALTAASGQPARADQRRPRRAPAARLRSGSRPRPTRGSAARPEAIPVRRAERRDRPASRPRRGGLADPPHRQQADPGRAQQGQRVEVGRRPGAGPSAGRRRAAQWLGAGSSTPSTAPAAHPSPRDTRAATGSYVVRSPPGWSTDTTPRPATRPANATVPSPAASTRAARRRRQVDAAVPGRVRARRGVERRRPPPAAGAAASPARPPAPLAAAAGGAASTSPAPQQPSGRGQQRSQPREQPVQPSEVHALEAGRTAVAAGAPAGGRLWTAGAGAACGRRGRARPRGDFGLAARPAYTAGSDPPARVDFARPHPPPDPSTGGGALIGPPDPRTATAASVLPGVRTRTADRAPARKPTGARPPAAAGRGARKAGRPWPPTRSSP